jgi:hypothetical protein
MPVVDHLPGLIHVAVPGGADQAGEGGTVRHDVLPPGVIPALEAWGVGKVSSA